MHKVNDCSDLNAVVDIGFENSTYTVNEGTGTTDFCVFLTGRIERDLSLNVATIPAVSLGTTNIDHSFKPDISSLIFF